MREIAAFSPLVIHSPYLSFTAACLATYWQRYALFLGSHVAASPSDLAELLGPSMASKFNGSLASASRLACEICCAPFCQASESATT